MVICLERGADLHMFQLIPLPLTVSCFNKIQIGFAFLVPAHLGSPGKRAVKRVCVCSIYLSYSYPETIFSTYPQTPNLNQLCTSAITRCFQLCLTSDSFSLSHRVYMFMYSMIGSGHIAAAETYSELHVVRSFMLHLNEVNRRQPSE